MNNIKIIKDAGWIWILNTGITNREKVREEITGKYLFFCKNKDDIIALAKRILLKFNLLEAKVPLGEKPISGEEFVLCVYDKEPRLKNELKSYADEINIKYRYWKSDKETREGKYSDKFLENIRGA